jgi:replicative DNA helicase
MVANVKDIPPEDGAEDNSAAEEFDEPIPLTPNTVHVPAFPLDALPDVIVDMVTELAEATQTDPAMAGTSALSTLAGIVGGHAEIQVRRGWREPLCLFTVTIARPGERKSAVQSAMIRPINDAEASLAFAGEIERVALADQLDMAKKTVDQLNRDAVNAAAKAAKSDAPDKDKQTAAAAAHAAKDAKAAMREIQVPVIPRLLADDVTPEATASLLADHGGRIAIISAEGGIFDTIAGRYARTVNMDVYLKGHSGDPLRVDRQTRPPVYIPRPALTVGLMVQPRIIEAIAANRDFVGRGLLARFLYANPPSKLGLRAVGATPVSENTESRYSHWIKKLASDMAGWEGDPAVLMLDPRAETVVRSIEEAIEPTLAGDGELASPSTLTEWGSKYVGAVVRIAGLLHLGQHGEVGHSYPVQPETIEAAERIGRYFKAAAITVFSRMGADPDTADAVYLLDRVEYLSQDEVSERELFTASSRPRFPTMKAMAPALDRLIEHGYLIPQPPSKPTGGRPASPRYKVHPTSAQAAKPAKGWS